MKKYGKLLVVMSLVLLLAGCGKINLGLSKEKVLTCTKTTTDEDSYYNDTDITKLRVSFSTKKILKSII